jgi:hypothetical protein
LVYALNTQGGFLDLLDTLTLSFKDSVVQYKPEGFLVYEDSVTTTKSVDLRMDSSQSKMYFNTTWKPGAKYRMIIQKNAAIDSSKRTITENDTIGFTVKDESQYGSLRLRFKQLNFLKRPVLLFYQSGSLKYSYPLAHEEFIARLFRPGNYQIAMLYDLNCNAVWDPGDYFTKPRKQPEIVLAIDKEVVVKENWDNELEISLINDTP